MARIRELCKQSDFESLFWDDEASHPLRLLLSKRAGSVKLSTDIVERHVDMLTTTQERENEFFWQEAAASNLLAYLYLITDEERLALEQLSLTLQHNPNNLNAIVGMIRILERLEQVHDSEAREKLDQLKNLKEDSKEMEKQKYICQGEIAYACSFIGPEFYEQAVDRYEDLLNHNMTMTDELHGYIIRWHYYLAYTYNRMLNKGHREKLAEKLGTKDMRAVFDKISKLYEIVIRSDDTFYKGRAMIDLVDTHKKCETSGQCQDIHFPYSCGPDQYVKDAMEAAPSDPHVLERCGRHYRQRARSKKDFEETVKIFDKLLELHPTRHVGWHQKGLACRALWHITGKYEVDRLYSNPARTGDKKKQFRKKNRSRTHVDGASAAAAERQNYSSVSVSHQGTCTNPSVQFHSMPVDEQATDRPTQHSHSNLREPPQNAPRECPTLHPYNRRQIGPGDVPRQTKKPYFFDKLRTNNPSAKDNGPRMFLEEAQNCFERAKAITKGTCSRYVVDLARSLVSLGMHDEAEREFNEANKLASTMNNNDATYLYEQWALLRHDRAKQAETPDGDISKMKDVARLYRQAILCAVRARDRSRMAFYKLKDLLRDELQRDPDNRPLQIEYSVLCHSEEKYSESKEMHILVEALKNDEDTRTVAWDMIKLLHIRRHPRDAATAFMYLTALHEADQLDLEDSADGQKSNKQFLLDVVQQLVCDGDQTNAGRGQTFREIFRWMVGTRYISDYITLDKNSPKAFAERSGICILAPSVATPGLATVLRVLQDVCGIAVVKAFCEGTDDVPCGCSILEGLRVVVAVSQAVVVVEDSTDTENWNCMFPVLDELMTIREVKVCFVADEQTDCSNTEQRYVKRWPRVVITGDTDIQLAYTVLSAMFCESNE